MVKKSESLCDEDDLEHNKGAAAQEAAAQQAADEQELIKNCELLYKFVLPAGARFIPVLLGNAEDGGLNFSVLYYCENELGHVYATGSCGEFVLPAGARFIPVLVGNAEDGGLIFSILGIYYNNFDFTRYNLPPIETLPRLAAEIERVVLVTVTEPGVEIGYPGPALDLADLNTNTHPGPAEELDPEMGSGAEVGSPGPALDLVDLNADTHPGPGEELDPDNDTSTLNMPMHPIGGFFFDITSGFHG